MASRTVHAAAALAMLAILATVAQAQTNYGTRPQQQPTYGTQQPSAGTPSSGTPTSGRPAYQVPPPNRNIPGIQQLAPSSGQRLPAQANTPHSTGQPTGYNNQNPPVRPQPGSYQPPTLVQRNPQAQPTTPQATTPPPVGAPFRLTPQQQAGVDAVLRSWETYSQQVENFSCSFNKFEYKRISTGEMRRTTKIGNIKYKAPDHGLYEVLGQYDKDGYAEGLGATKFVCDGKAVYQYIWEKDALGNDANKIEQFDLTPEMQGSGAIDNGPLPFVFGARAENLKARYTMRIITPTGPDYQDQVWIEAWPRTVRDASDFRYAKIILKRSNMSLQGLVLHNLNRHDYDTYHFEDTKLNEGFGISILNPFAGDPFKVTVPRGWTLIPREIPKQQVGNRPQTLPPR